MTSKKYEATPDILPPGAPGLTEPELTCISPTAAKLLEDQRRVEEKAKQMWSDEKNFWTKIIKGLKIGSTLDKLWTEGGDEEKKEVPDTSKLSPKGDQKSKKLLKSPTMKDLALPMTVSMRGGALGRNEIKKRLTMIHQVDGRGEVRREAHNNEKSLAELEDDKEKQWDPKARNMLGPKFHKFSEIGEESMNEEQFMSFLRDCDLLDPDFKEEDAHQLFHLVVRRNRIRGKLSSTNLAVDSIGYEDFEALMTRVAEMKGGYQVIAEACSRDSEKAVISIPATRKKLRHIFNAFRGITKERFLQGVGPHSEGDFVPNKAFYALQDNHMVVGAGASSRPQRVSTWAARVSIVDDKELMTVHDFIDFCDTYKLFGRGWAIADVYFFFAKRSIEELDFEDFLEALEEMAEKRGLTTEMLLYSSDGILAFIPSVHKTRVGKTVYPPDDVATQSQFPESQGPLPGQVDVSEEKFGHISQLKDKTPLEVYDED